jgi:hypothetical protein
MRFIRDWIAQISPRSQLAAALSSRVGALEMMRDPFELSGVPLRKGTAAQENEEILRYKSPTGSVDKTVECVVSESRFRSLRLPESVIERTRTSGQYRRFELRGQLHYSPFGLVFGVLLLS